MTDIRKSYESQSVTLETFKYKDGVVSKKETTIAIPTTGLIKRSCVKLIIDGIEAVKALSILSDINNMLKAVNEDYIAGIISGIAKSDYENRFQRMTEECVEMIKLSYDNKFIDFVLHSNGIIDKDVLKNDKFFRDIYHLLLTGERTGLRQALENFYSSFLYKNDCLEKIRIRVNEDMIDKLEKFFFKENIYNSSGEVVEMYNNKKKLYKELCIVGMKYLQRKYVDTYTDTEKVEAKQTDTETCHCQQEKDS